MYIPSSFKEENPEVLFALIEKYNFGILFSQHNNQPEATHLPFLVEKGDGNTTSKLIAHFARANQHWQHIDENKEILVVFQGPHSYITPSWYEKKETVPTWNYAAVHVYGKPALIHSEEKLKVMADQLTYFQEGQVDSDWKYEEHHGYRDKLLKGIVGIKIDITRMKGNFKFNQNRSEQDQKGVIKALSESDNEMLREVSRIMRKNLEKNG